MFSELNKYETLTTIHNKIIKKVNLFTSSYEKASNYTYMLIFIYIIVVLVSTLLISFANNVWYVKAIDIGLMMILPYTIIKVVINIKYAFVKKQIPVAVEEFQYWFFRTRKIDDSLRETSQHLKGPIVKPFQMCYYNISKGETVAIKLLKDTFGDKYMDLFCQLLIAYLENGGSPQALSTALTDLKTQINQDISFTQKQKDRFLKYKIGAVILIFFTIVINKYLGLLFSTGINTNQTEANSILIFFTIYFFFIDLLEHF